MRQIFVDGVSQFCDWQRLQPDSSRAAEAGKKDSVAAEDHILDASPRPPAKVNARYRRLFANHVPNALSAYLQASRPMALRLGRDLEDRAAIISTALVGRAVEIAGG